MKASTRTRSSLCVPVHGHRGLPALSNMRARALVCVWVCPGCPSFLGVQQSQLAWKSPILGVEWEQLGRNYKLFHNFSARRGQFSNVWISHPSIHTYRGCCPYSFQKKVKNSSFSWICKQLIGETAVPPGDRELHIHWYKIFCNTCVWWKVTKKYAFQINASEI